jgi:hypothetical protein
MLEQDEFSREVLQRIGNEDNIGPGYNSEYYGNKGFHPFLPDFTMTVHEI